MANTKIISELDVKKFINEETPEVLHEVLDPIDSFRVEDEKNLRDEIIETGIVEPGVFARCAVFSPSHNEERFIRYEAKRAKEIVDIVTMVDEEEGADVDTACARLYAEKVVYQASLVEAARKYIIGLRDDTLSDRDQRLYGGIIRDSQERLYTLPDSRIIRHIKQKLYSGLVEVDHDQMKQIYERYPFLYPEPGHDQIEVLSDEKRLEYRAVLKEWYDPAFEYVRENMSTVLNNASLPEATRHFMQSVGIRMWDGKKGWRCEQTDEVAGFRVDPEREIIYCGRRSAEISWGVFEGLMIHEVAVHVVRAQNGEQLGQAFKVGLPGSNDSEEGAGILLQSIWQDKPTDEIGRDYFRYLSVCYASGDLDGMHHNEQEVLDFITDIMAAQKQDGLHNEAERRRVRGMAAGAVEHVYRIFRGMPPGEVLVSNLSYLSGKIMMMGYMQASNNVRETIEEMQQCKIDLLNQEHRALRDQALMILQAER